MRFINFWIFSFSETRERVVVVEGVRRIVASESPRASLRPEPERHALPRLPAAAKMGSRREPRRDLFDTPNKERYVALPRGANANFAAQRLPIHGMRGKCNNACERHRPQPPCLTPLPTCFHSQDH